jgi:hypothetical protein
MLIFAAVRDPGRNCLQQIFSVFCTHRFMFQEIFLGAGRTLELIETKEIEQLLKTIIDVSTCKRYILSVPRAMPK